MAHTTHIHSYTHTHTHTHTAAAAHTNRFVILPSPLAFALIQITNPLTDEVCLAASTLI